MTSATVSTRPFEFGRVVENSLRALAADGWVFLGLSALFVGAPSVIGGMILQHLIEAGVLPASGFQATVDSIDLLAIVGVFAYPASAGIYFATIARLRGERASFGECLRIGVTNWAPLFGLSIVMGLAQTVGYALLIVPGLVLTVMWAAALPLKVIEGVSINRALDRSRALTKGRRWPIFGLLLLMTLAIFLVGAVVGFVVGFGWGFMRAVRHAANFPPYAHIAPVATAIGQTLARPISSATYACLYAELRGQSVLRTQTVADTFA
jgi:hypothetical protein